MEFRNADNIDLNGDVTLTIDTKIKEPSGNQEDGTFDDGYETVPIGSYVIDTTPEDYYKNAKITCYDKSVLFKKNIDISQWFDENSEITAEKLLQELCNYFLGENMLGTYPEIHRDLKTGSYDNTLSGKNYISQIAGEDDNEKAVVGKVNLINEAIKFLQTPDGGKPSVKSIADYTGLDEEELSEILDIIEKADKK